jgi:pimeloyl-ACP methyl ester carboxylesterase
MRRLLGLKDFVHDAIRRTTDLVEETHEAGAAKPVRVLSQIPELKGAVEAVDVVRRGVASLVFDSIRATNDGVRIIEDAGIAAVTAVVGRDVMESTAQKIARSFETPLRSDAIGSPGWLVDSAQGVLNGVMGDALGAIGNTLSIELGAYRDGVHVSPQEWAASVETPSDTLVVFVHGLGCTEWSWTFDAEALHGDAGVNFGTLLARDFGFTPLYIRYNTGLHVSDNGQKLARFLNDIVQAYPAKRILLVGHSMGGLVVRSAAHYGKATAAPWASALTHVFCIGSPNLGAPLEKAGNVLASVLALFDVAGTQVPAKILNGRSSGIKDLRFGYVVDEDWKDKDPDALLEDNRQSIPFVDGVLYCFVAGTLSKDPSHKVNDFLGDVLVRLPSASGHAPAPARRIPFHIGHVVGGVHHLALGNHPDVYAQIARVLRGEAPVL